jgi:hypothetical protein
MYRGADEDLGNRLRHAKRKCGRGTQNEPRLKSLTKGGRQVVYKIEKTTKRFRSKKFNFSLSRLVKEEAKYS